MIKLAALWLKESEKGKFFVGALGDASLFIFKNKNKKAGSNMPDYELFITENKTKSDKKYAPKAEPEEDEGF